MNDESNRIDYTSYPSRGEYWGVLKIKESWERERWGDNGNWEWCDYERKYLRISDRPEGSPRGDVWRLLERGASALLGFGSYYDGSYGEILPGKPNYVSYLGSESEDVCEGQKKFKGWVERKECSVGRDAQASRPPRQKKNMPTVGWEFGLLVISRNQEANPPGEDAQWLI